ncbi:hypothetical protein, partial [Paenibacillus sp. 7516]|uniref:hypothetical protein n=1 Tax=Paenibacillus sp. 7516 TaxID=2022549 RepID=UPI000BC7739E
SREEKREKFIFSFFFWEKGIGKTDFEPINLADKSLLNAVLLYFFFYKHELLDIYYKKVNNIYIKWYRGGG